MHSNAFLRRAIEGHIRPLSCTSSFVKWHSAVHELYCLQWRLHCANGWVQPNEWQPKKVFPLLEFLWITWQPKKLHLSLRSLCLQSAAKQKPSLPIWQMHSNYFRISTILCHLTAVFNYMELIWRLRYSLTYMYSSSCVFWPKISPQSLPMLFPWLL